MFLLQWLLDPGFGVSRVLGGGFLLLIAWSLCVGGVVHAVCEWLIWHNSCGRLTRSRIGMQTGVGPWEVSIG